MLRAPWSQVWGWEGSFCAVLSLARRGLGMLLLCGCGLVSANSSIPTADYVASSEELLTIERLERDIGELASTWMRRLSLEGVPDTRVLFRARTEVSRSKPLATVPLAHRAALNILNDLVTLTEDKSRWLARQRHAVPGRKPALSPLSGYEWAQEEGIRLRKNWESHYQSVASNILRNLDTIERSSITPNGSDLRFQPDESALLALFSAVMISRFEINDLLRRKQSIEFQCSLLEVREGGSIVQSLDSTGRSERIFVIGLDERDLKKGQKLSFDLEWDGIYPYIDAEGVSRFVASWRVIPPPPPFEPLPRTHCCHSRKRDCFNLCPSSRRLPAQECLR